ncbi:unnamed protein product [Orchesella dallaii]|uniref:Diacylglycerol O-acyltransferase n=1 Tax=Orchesella dallaii TaxID=48710 RepID=A0ABP1Q9Z7_9HEXA
MNINFFMFIDGPCDIEKLRERIAANISQADKSGRGYKPFGEFLYGIVEKFGYFCFEDRSSSIDFNHHIRVCPGADDLNKIYSEDDMFSIVERLYDEEWDQEKPRWEVLVIPNIRKNGKDKACSALVIRIFHMYVDGISFVQFLRNCVMDQPPQKLSLDPVNPPIPPVSFLNKILVHFKAYFMGPYISLRLMGVSTAQTMYEGELKKGKLMGRTKMNISLEMMKRIRKSYNCTTQGIFHSAFNGALKKVAEQKNVKIADEILAGVTFVRFPYPNEYPQNRASMAMDLMKIGIDDPITRLKAINDSVVQSSRMEIVLWTNFLITLVGLYPATMIKAMFASLTKFVYFLSNVPGLKGVSMLNNQEIDLIFGMSPLVSGMRCSIGIGCYNGSFCAGMIVNKSELFKSRPDLDLLIQEFENELKYLDANSSV